MKLDLLVANILNGYETRIEQLDGLPHMVAPTIILVEGVHHGSAGPILYPGVELSTFPASWNGVPVTIQHPSVDGEMVSANHPDILAEFCVGRLFNTTYDEEIKGLRSEIWVDISRISNISPEAWNLLIGREAIEVSTGLWFDDEGTPGNWLGEEYEMVATAMRPDHLALLPGNRGACSLEDGCGVRANDAGEEESLMGIETDKKFIEVLKRGLYGLKGLILGNRISEEDKRRTLQGLIDALDKPIMGGQIIHYLVATYEGSFVMRQESPDGGKYLEGSFLTDGEGMPMSIGTNFEEVEERREFVSTGNVGEDKPVKNKEEAEAEPNKEEHDMKKEELVNSLVACNRTRWAEDDREFLMGLNEEDLEKMQPVDEAPAVDPPVADPVEEPTADVTMEDYLAGAPEAVREVLTEGLKLQKEKRTSLISNITGQERNVFTDEQLKTKSMDELVAINSLIVPSEPDADDDTPDEGDGEPATKEEGVSNVVPMERPNFNDYTGAGGAVNTSSEEGDVEPMGRPNINDQVGE